ncbi:alpha/beta fold hydrolase [Patulibacter brassicae]|uniref:Alpha/beta fold hydrolase n=1 Tax=Patulibacter brassicae TaxID=1705717 RepID=A0ABU4VMS6_9ACTN|nr:alpha/beta fold hydrolase [Patulibacter brassicae]MDX8153142.1 alpha/beta fold hydrolase [Patulibacter brassicae]
MPIAAPGLLRRPRLRVVALALGLLAAPGTAAAADDVRCGDASLGVTRCARVPVPLDRTGAVPGQIGLSVRTLQLGQRTRRVRREAVVLLAGGPGQAATPLLGDVAPVLAPLLRRRDLVAVDTRGTGRSTDLVVCPEIESGSRTGLDPWEPLRSCARRFGGALDRYGTTDVVADLEEVRRARGYDRLLLVGVSYGTVLAQRYAAAHPARVSGLVLDSPVDVQAADPFSLAMLRAIPGALRQACVGGACDGVTKDLRGDLRRLRARLPMTVSVDGGTGRRVPLEVDGWLVTSLVVAGDLDPLLRAALPAAIRRGAEGDAAPLARLGRENGLAPLTTDDADPSGGPAAAAYSSSGVYYDTTCRDGRWPWSAEAAVGDERWAQARAAAAARPDAARAGWSPDVVLQVSAAGSCAFWPGTRDATPAGRVPAVPTLVLSGRSDTRTSPEEARAVAASIPGARLLAVPGQGHSVLTSGRRCVTGALRAFDAGRAPGRCHRPAGRVRAVPLAPRTAHDLGRTPADRARAVARLTVEDAGRSVVLRLVSQVLGTAAPGATDAVRVAGLRSGYAAVGRRGISLRRMGYVPGTAASTVAPIAEQRTIAVRVRGRGVRAGTYRIPNPIRTNEQLLAITGIDLDALLEQALGVEVTLAVRSALRALGR